MATGHLTLQRLREVLHYEPATGVFTWLRRPLAAFKDLRACEAWNGRYACSQAGGISGVGHISIRIDDKAYWAHRLAVFYVTGEWPVGEVDHRDGVKTNNRYDNLRDVTGQTNRQNIRIPQRTKKSGLPLGVYRHARLKKTPFSATLHTGGASVFLGYYATADKAHQAYLDAKRSAHVGCTI